MKMGREDNSSRDRIGASIEKSTPGIGLAVFVVGAIAASIGLVGRFPSHTCTRFLVAGIILCSIGLVVASMGNMQDEERE